MRGWLIVLMAVLILSVVVHATANETLCTDTDGGGATTKPSAPLKTKGEVQYGITTQVDTCLTSQEGVSTNESKWLKEYFCENDQRDSQVYDCIKLGFNGCFDGECKAFGNLSNQTQETTAPVVVCGNHIIDKNASENCDPPGKICFGSDGRYGICGSNCVCKVSGAAKAPPAVCGDDNVGGDEECEKDDDCSEHFVCSSCKCVKQLTAEEIAAMKGNKTVEKEEEQVEEEHELPEVNLTGTNFTEEPGIKATSGIANFFKKIFAWILGLFS